MSFDLGANPLRHDLGVFRTGLRQNHHELVATITYDAIGIAYRRQEQRSHLHQTMRADQMAMKIVYVLEIVEIEKQRGDLRAITSRPLNLVYEKLPQISGVVQTRKFIR